MPLIFRVEIIIKNDRITRMVQHPGRAIPSPDSSSGSPPPAQVHSYTPLWARRRQRYGPGERRSETPAATRRDNREPEETGVGFDWPPAWLRRPPPEGARGRAIARLCAFAVERSKNYRLIYNTSNTCSCYSLGSLRINALSEPIQKSDRPRKNSDFNRSSFFRKKLCDPQSLPRSRVTHFL